MYHWNQGCINLVMMIIVLSVLWIETEGQAWGDSYRVLGVSQPALVRSPLSAAWRNIPPGVTLHADSIIQIGANGYIMIEWEEKRSQERQTYQLTIDKPLTIRLHTPLLREIQQNKFKIDQGDYGLEANTKTTDFSWDEAWNRFAAVFSITPENLTKAKIQNEHGIQLAARKHQIQLISPRAQEFIYGEPGQVLQLIWKEGDKQLDRKHKTYAIYVWPQSSQRLEPIAITSRNRYQVSLDQYAVYHIQIESTDGSESSPIHTVQLIPRSFEKRASQSMIQLEFPKNGSSILTKQSKYNLAFTWHDPSCIAKECRYQWLLYNQTGQLIANRILSESSTTMDLEAGSYSWHIAYASEEMNSNQKSVEHKHHFEIRKGHSVEAIFSHQKWQDKQIYLENGL